MGDKRSSANKVRLGDIATMQMGLFVPKDAKAKKGSVDRPAIHVADISDDGTLRKCKELATVRVPADNERGVVKTGDVLLTARGAKIKAALLGRSHAGAVASSNIMVIRPATGVDGQALAEHFRSPAGQADLDGRRTGVAIRMLSIKAASEINVQLARA
jgi:hypothetical protein